MSAFCQRPVSDNADGGEYCGEPVMPGLEKTCYDHAHVCVGPPTEATGEGFHSCGDPTDYDQIFCPTHLTGMKDQPTNES